MTRKTTDIDWWAVTQAAQGLGITTRRLVALHDPDAAITWALRMRSEHTGPAALSYYELAVMPGHRDAKVTAAASLDYAELLRAVETLHAAVKVKAAEEKRAAEEAAAAVKAAAEEKAAAAKAAREKAAAEAASEESAVPDNAEDLADDVDSEAVGVSADDV